MFEEGARYIFTHWTGLCLAVENQWGGPTSAQKADDLLRESIQWFYSSRGWYAHAQLSIPGSQLVSVDRLAANPQSTTLMNCERCLRKACRSTLKKWTSRTTAQHRCVQWIHVISLQGQACHNQRQGRNCLRGLIIR
jgi:hypothetical protein